MTGKEIRFSELVKASGKPEIVSLWTDPKQNRPFMKAVRENRVLTVSQEPAIKKKDFGRIGFHQDKHAAYLVFPKPLIKNSGSRVVGIKYDLVEQPRVTGPLAKTPRERRAPKARARPVEKSFTFVIRRTAIIETSVSVPARDEPEARRQALRIANSEVFNPAKAIVRNEVIATEVRSEK